MTAPFYAGSVAHAGVNPMVPVPWTGRSARFWLGKPGLMMVELPAPAGDGSYVPTTSAGEVEHALMGGGSAVTRFDSAMRRWVLPYAYLTGRDFEVINAFYRRVMVGPGPWVYVPPEDTNRLTLAQSMCGSLHGAVEGWTATSGALSYLTTPAGAVFPCGVLQWAGTSGAVLAADAVGASGAVDVDHAAPYLPDEACTFTVQARTSTGSSTLAVRLSGRDVNGAVVTEATGSTAAVTSGTWEPVTVTAAAGALGASAYVVAEVVGQASVNYRLSCPQLEYSPTLSDWCSGSGVPRVIWPVARGDRPVTPLLASAVTMTLAETIPGAC